MNSITLTNNETINSNLAPKRRELKTLSRLAKPGRYVWIKTDPARQPLYRLIVHSRLERDNHYSRLDPKTFEKFRANHWLELLKPDEIITWTPGVECYVVSEIAKKFL